MLPILIVLFLVSYGLMSLLAVEQDRTIASQRWLIMSLLQDSTELSGLKGKLIQQQRAQAKTQAEAGVHSQAQTPSNQVPETQVSPDTQENNVQRNHHTDKARKTVPPKPPLGVADLVDGRRIANKI